MDDSLLQQPENQCVQDLGHFNRFLHLFHVFYERPEVAPELLCQQIALMTKGHVQLMLNVHEATNQSDIPVRYRKKHYGLVHINSPLQEASLIQEAQALAEECGRLLNGFRVATSLQNHLQGINQKQNKPLTEQEMAVLTLMEQRKRTSEIAQELKIEPGTVQVHQKKVYLKLGVHNKHDALLVASMLGLTAQNHSLPL